MMAETLLNVYKEHYDKIKEEIIKIVGCRDYEVCMGCSPTKYQLEVNSEVSIKQASEIENKLGVKCTHLTPQKNIFICEIVEKNSSTYHFEL